MNEAEELALAEAWLDQLDPDTVEGRGTEHFHRIRQAVRSGDRDRLTREISLAREAGDSWAMVGCALGISGRAAQSQFG
ncbi:hypothetical protein [Williamsia limnetica]|nr:hypothetical protein [Williamsia limnetica]